MQSGPVAASPNGGSHGTVVLPLEIHAVAHTKLKLKMISNENPDIKILITISFPLTAPK